MRAASFGRHPSIVPDVLLHREQLRSEKIRLLTSVPKSVALIELRSPP